MKQPAYELFCNLDRLLKGFWYKKWVVETIKFVKALASGKTASKKDNGISFLSLRRSLI